MEGKTEREAKDGAAHAQFTPEYLTMAASVELLGVLGSNVAQVGQVIQTSQMHTKVNHLVSSPPLSALAVSFESSIKVSRRVSSAVGILPRAKLELAPPQVGHHGLGSLLGRR